MWISICLVSYSFQSASWFLAAVELLVAIFGLFVRPSFSGIRAASAGEAEGPILPYLRTPRGIRGRGRFLPL